MVRHEGAQGDVGGEEPWKTTESVIVCQYASLAVGELRLLDPIK